MSLFPEAPRVISGAMNETLRHLLSALRRPAPVPDGYVACPVTLAGGPSFRLVIDADTTDPVAHHYRAGRFCNAYMFDTLRHFLGRKARLLDLGGHIGTCALAAAAAGHEVVVVDASAKHVDLLRRSVAANRFRRVRVVHAAVGDQSGVLRFHSNGLWGMVDCPGLDGPTEEVRCVTGDDLLREVGWDRADAVKMDIEGFEGKAIDGMSRLLSRDDGPVLLYESNGLTLPYYGIGPGDVMRRLESLGYRVYRTEGERFRPCSSADAHPEAWVDVVALKPWHQAQVAGRIGPPLTEAEWAQKCVHEGTVAEPIQRAYIARALRTAGPGFLVNPAVRSLLDALARDPAEPVREAAAWWVKRACA
ncbi:MAG TPA: FkbM family methyltransferase [Gemmataceae bacterium]|nr:FkbM family methyltransferase [Gemmataceae bacterium]